jgi:hypothetical protein
MRAASRQFTFCHAASVTYKMQSKPKIIWRSPEEIVEIAFERASVVMMNEAHNGWKRCIRTRQIGQRILPVAHQAGVRHLAMEALIFPAMAAQCNATRRVPEHVTGYLSQPEMAELVQSALGLDWTLISYEADAIQWLSARHNIEHANPDDLQEIQSILQVHQAELASMEFTNWREEQQARNLIKALESLPTQTPLLVWCGNSHQSKRPLRGWVPMGYQLKQLSGLDPFSIDQTRTANFTDDPYHFEPFEEFAQDLAANGGTAGFLLEEAPPRFMHNTDADAFLLSIHNKLE